MGRNYKWNFDYLVNLREDYLKKAEKSTRECDILQYQDIADEISNMLFMIMASDGRLESMGVRQQELLDCIRGIDYVDDYSDLTEDLVDRLVPELANLSILPNVKYKKK